MEFDVTDRGPVDYDYDVEPQDRMLHVAKGFGASDDTELKLLDTFINEFRAAR